MVPALLPEETDAPHAPGEAERWLAVYTHLVDGCRAKGLVHRRFEERLAYWQRVRHGYTPPARLRAVGDGGGAARPRRCPLARLGLDSELMAACPGYSAAQVSFPNLVTTGAVVGSTCAHLATARNGRGFAAICGHPGAAPSSRQATGRDGVTGSQVDAVAS